MPDYDSPFFITNDRTYIDQDAIEDGSAVVWPLSADAAMTRSPERQYCGNYVTYGDKGAATYRHNDDTHALIAAGPNQHRDMVSSFPLVKTLAKAQARGDRQLLDVQEQDVRVTTTLTDIPAERVTLAKAGMRLQVKGTHWGPTLDTWHYGRIVTAQPKPHSKGDLYDIDLEIVIGTPIDSFVSDGPPPPPPGTATAGGILFEPGNAGGTPPASDYFLKWASDGDNPGIGMIGGVPLDTANFAYMGSQPTREGFRVLAAAALLDLDINVSFIDVALGPTTYTLELRQNGGVVATAVHVYSGAGVSGVTGDLIIATDNLPAAAGDELTLHLVITAVSGVIVPFGINTGDRHFKILNTSTVAP